MLLTTPHTIRTLQRKLYAKAKPNTAHVACSEFERAGATASVASENMKRRHAHAWARRTSESRVRENCMHGLMREGRRRKLWQGY